MFSFEPGIELIPWKIETTTSPKNHGAILNKVVNINN